MKKIAIPTNDGKLWVHFGKAPQVTFVTIDNNKVIAKEVKDSPAHGHGVMAEFLAENGVEEVVCGGLGAGAIQTLGEKNISIHAGAPAIDIDELMKTYLDGTIVYGDGKCNHDHCNGEHHHHEHSILIKKG